MRDDKGRFINEPALASHFREYQRKRRAAAKAKRVRVDASNGQPSSDGVNECTDGRYQVTVTLTKPVYEKLCWLQKQGEALSDVMTAAVNSLWANAGSWCRR